MLLVLLLMLNIGALLVQVLRHLMLLGPLALLALPLVLLALVVAQLVRLARLVKLLVLERLLARPVLVIILLVRVLLAPALRLGRQLVRVLRVVAPLEQALGRMVLIQSMIFAKKTRKRRCVKLS
jgi:hypothetical protein